jgi:hypothetical protein
MRDIIFDFLVLLAGAVVICVLLLMFAATPVNAQSLPCGNRADFIRTLADKHSETSKAMGIANRTNLIEIFTSAKGTWTIMVTQPNGLTCIIATGADWQDVKPEIQGRPL